MPKQENMSSRHIPTWQMAHWLPHSMTSSGLAYCPYAASCRIMAPADAIRTVARSTSIPHFRSRYTPEHDTGRQVLVTLTRQNICPGPREMMQMSSDSGNMYTVGQSTPAAMLLYCRVSGGKTTAIRYRPDWQSRLINL